jgi:hypothetical protein
MPSQKFKFTSEEPTMRFILTISVVLALSLPALAQKCSEEFIRQNIDSRNRKVSADDAYFFSGALEKPIIGFGEEGKTAEEKINSERKHDKQDPLIIDKIVVAPSGEMAYTYGTGHVGYQEVATGKHVDFTAAYLMVWKVVDGSCKIAATMFQPEGER